MSQPRKTHIPIQQHQGKALTIYEAHTGPQIPQRRSASYFSICYHTGMCKRRYLKEINPGSYPTNQVLTYMFEQPSPLRTVQLSLSTPRSIHRTFYPVVSVCLPHKVNGNNKAPCELNGVSFSFSEHIPLRLRSSLLFEHLASFCGDGFCGHVSVV